MATKRLATDEGLDRIVSAISNQDTVKARNAEIDAHAKEVMDSLPSDYTTLVNNVNELKDDITCIEDDTKQYLYVKKPYDRQLFDISTMIPSEPLMLAIQKSTSLITQNTSYRMYVVEINGKAGETYSYNLLSKNGEEVENLKEIIIAVSNKIPEADDIVEVGINSVANMRGLIKLTSDAKYLLLSIILTVPSYPHEAYTASCNDIMSHIVVRKGTYDTTYYEYEEYADYVCVLSEENLDDHVKNKINEKGTDEQTVKNIITETVPTWSLSESKPSYTPSEVGSVSKAQGSDNKGKILIVGSDGNVSLGENTEVTPDVAVRYHPVHTFYVGDNVIDDSTVVTMGENWSGDFISGYTHVPGKLDEIVFEVATEVNESYVIEFDVSVQCIDNMGVTIGNEPYCDPYNGKKHYVVGVISDGGYLKIKATNTNLDTKVTNIQLRKVGTSGAKIEIESKNVNSGQTTKNITGFWNVAIGTPETQTSNQNGSRNIAIGIEAQRKLKSGTRNISIGTFAMPFVTEGDRNIAIGADTIYNTISFEESKAYDNVAIGKATMANGVLIIRNVAIGSGAMSKNDENASDNVCIGHQSGFYAHNKNTHVGERAGYYTKGDNNTSLGYNAGNETYVTGDNNVCIGYNSGFDIPDASADDIKSVDDSIVIGAGAKATKSNQMMLGSSNITEVVLCGDKKIIFNDDGTVTWETIS